MERFNSFDEGGFVFHCINSESLAQLNQTLKDQQFIIYILNGSRIHDKRSLFEELYRQLPFDPDFGPSKNLIWDALMDSISGGLLGQPEHKVAIVWLDADRILGDGLQTLLDFVEAFTLEADRLSDIDEDQEANLYPILLRVFLVGISSNFPSFDN